MPKPCVLAVGKFECFHLGHKALVAKMMKYGCGLASALVVFEPHPNRVLVNPGYKPLFVDNEREYLARELGVDYLLKYPFDKQFAAIPPEDFCHMLFSELQARVVVVGAGYRFGYKRAGTIDTLRMIASEYGAQVKVAALCGVGDTEAKISTSTIRELLCLNKLGEAESLLGYPFFLMGNVEPGWQLGCASDMPTIKLYPCDDKFLPPDGVYDTRVCVDGHIYTGVTDVGTRPAMDGIEGARIVETHIHDCENGVPYDLLTRGQLPYGQWVRVEFIRFVRP